MATSSDQVGRLLALVPYLQKHPRAEVSATAEAFGITPRQLLNDLHVLWFCGLPGGLPDDLIEIDMDAVESDGVITLSNAGFLARPMRFTPGEVVSLVVALRALREVASGPLVGAIDSALGKLDAASQAAPAPGIGVRVASGEAAIREALNEALADGARIRLEYAAASRTEPDSPLVDPGRIVVSDGFAYLQAWAFARKGWRTYRLDRILGVTRTGRTAVGHGEPPSFDAGWLDNRPDATPVTLTLAPQASWIAAYYPVLESEPVPSGTRVRLLIADPAWLRSLLLRLGPSVLSVDPPEAARGAGEAASAALRLYGVPAPG